MAAVSIETIRRITVQARADGAAEAEAALNRVRVATKDLDATNEQASKNMASNAAAVLRARRSFEELFAATEKLTKLQKDLVIGVSAGRVTQEQANRIYDAAADKLTGYSKALEVAAREQEKVQAGLVSLARDAIKAEAAQIALNRATAVASQRNIGTNLGFREAPDVEGRAQDFLAAAAAADRLRAKHDDLFAAQERYAMGLREVNEAERAGILTAGLATAAREKLGLAYAKNVHDMGEAARQVARTSQNNLRDNLGFREAPDIEQRGADMVAAIEAQDRLRAKYDQTFAAEQKLASATAEINGLVAAGGLAADVAAKAIDRESEAYRRQIDAINGVVKASEPLSMAQKWANLRADAPAARQGMTSDQAGAALGSMSSTGLPAMSAAAQRARNELVPLAAAQDELSKATMKADQALKADLINQAERDAAVARSTATFHNQRIEIDKADQANARAAKGSGLNAYAWQNLSFQVNDVVTSLASGISPMQTLAQQGGQVVQILQSDQGGVVGGLKSIRDRLLGLITPANLVFAGIAAGAATAAYALYSYQNGQNALRQQTSGIGRASGATPGSINALAPEAARAAGVSTASAREMAGAFAATGKIGQDQFAGLIKVTREYAVVTGKDAAEATAAMAEAFASPTEGAMKLNKEMGFLTVRSLEAIRAMEASGDSAGARRLLMEGLATSTNKAAERLGFFSKQWQEFKTNTSNEIDAIGGFISKGLGLDDAESKLRTLEGQLDFRQRNKGRMGGLLDGLLNFDEGQIRAEVAKARAVVDAAVAEGAQVKRNQRAIEVNELVRGLNPGTVALEKMEQAAANIKKSFDDLGIKDPFGPAYNTMLGLEAAAKRMRADMAAGGAGYADATRQAQAARATVGFSEYGRGAADIENEAKERRIRAERDAAQNNDQGAYVKALESIEKDRITKLETLSKTTAANEAQIGGAFSRLSTNIQDQITAALRNPAYGKVTPGMIAGIAGLESTNNLSVGYSKSKGEDGRKSTAYGLGQITEGTARDAIKNGYLPQGFDRMNESTMAQGIAGVLAMKIDQAGGDVTKGIQNYRGSKDPSINSAYAAKVLAGQGQMGDISTTSLVKEEAARSSEIKAQNAIIAENKALLGQDNLTLEARTEAIRKIAAAELAGVQITDEYRAGIERATTQMAQQANSLKMIQFGNDNRFEREQLGRSEQDASAYAKARSVLGVTTGPDAEFIISQQKINDNLKETKALAKDAFSGIATDLSHGVSAMDALSSAFTRFADKLISTAADKAISGLFGGLTGGANSDGSGFLGTIATLFGGGSPLPKYAKGGIMTGPSIAGEAGPEAAVPLPDGRNIPVVLSQPANSNSRGPVNVQVNNTVSDRAEAQVTEASDGTLLIDILDKGLAKKQAAGRSDIGRAAQAGRRG